VPELAMLEGVLAGLVRDTALSKRRQEVEAAHGGHGYFLRSRAAAGAAVPGVVAVDHVWECQLVAHAIGQTEAFSAGGGGSVLGSVTLGAGRSGQPTVVLGALDPVYRIQNCFADPSLFNLRVMPQSLNATKGHVFTNWIAARRKRGDAGPPAPYRGGGAGLGELLVGGFRRSAAATRHEIDGDDAQVLADGVVGALRLATGVYEERLGVAAGAAGGAQARGCFEGLTDTLGGLLEELDGE
jgi:hypothetical protein